MKGPNEENYTNPRQSIPVELMEQIANLKKQNANATYELLKTQKVIQEFKSKLKELESRIDLLNPQKASQDVSQNTLTKLKELQRFLD